MDFQWVWVYWGTGVLAVVLAAAALATRRLRWHQSLGLMMAVFSLGTGALLLAWGSLPAFPWPSLFSSSIASPKKAGRPQAHG